MKGFAQGKKKEEGMGLSSTPAFVVLSSLARALIAKRARMLPLKQKNAFYKNEMLPQVLTTNR
jgi:hypothetical protein